MEGIILESMLEGYAEFYSAELSEKIQRAKGNALKGRSNGGGIPLGYLLGDEQKFYRSADCAVGGRFYPICRG